ncbi:MAG: anti-sigma F factor [Clostridia bacterium]
MERILKVQVEAALENLRLVRGITAAYASELDPTVEELTEIRTAVSEAFSNAVIHGYAGQLRGKVDLEFALISRTALMIKVIDKGVGIEDIARAMEPLFTTDSGEERSGMGFTVMESFMDKIKVDSRPDEGTTVTMIKNIDAYEQI